MSIGSTLSYSPLMIMWRSPPLIRASRLYSFFLPFTAQKKIFDHLAKLADVRCLSSEEQEKYDESIKAVDDYYSGLYGSYVEGEEKGIAKGRAEGELSKSLTIARNLLAMGMSLPQIVKATGLNEEQLKQLLE